MSRVEEWVATLNRIHSVVQDENVSMLAAGFAHYVLTAIVPLALLIVIGLSILGRLALLTRSIELLTNIRGWEFVRLLEVTTNEIPVRRRAAVLAGAILLWSSFRLFVAVDNAFMIVYEERQEESLLTRMVQAGYALVTIITAVGVLIALGIALTFVLKGENVLLAVILLFASLLILFFPMFYFFPGEQLSPADALPGTIVTALFWAVSGTIFRFYSTTSLSIHLYGAIGGLLLLLTWLYLGGIALIIGIILNGVLADASGINPDEMS